MVAHYLMIALFNTILFEPLLNILVALYNIIPDIGVGIIVLTLLLRVILWPLNAKTYRSQKAMQALQPQVKKIQTELKNNKEELSKALMALYKKEKINPLSSCLPVLIQLPFLIALYQVFQASLDSTKVLPPLYSFIANPEHLSPLFLSFIDLAKPNIPLALLAGASQFFQAKMMPVSPPPSGVAGSKDEAMTASMNRNMLYMMPVFTVVLGATLPSGLTLYWLITTIAAIAQQWFALRRKPPQSSAS